MNNPAQSKDLPQPTPDEPTAKVEFHQEAAYNKLATVVAVSSQAAGSPEHTITKAIPPMEQTPFEQMVQAGDDRTAYENSKAIRPVPDTFKPDSSNNTLEHMVTPGAATRISDISEFKKEQADKQVGAQPKKNADNNSGHSWNILDLFKGKKAA